MRFGPPPQHILCQTEQAGCGICCGAENFIDRGSHAHGMRFKKRTQLVEAADFDISKLELIKDQLLEEEHPYILSSTIPTCPFMGHVGPHQRGCLIHPSRHPEGLDIRDISVHDQETCAGFFCTAHHVLTETEVAIAQHVPADMYGVMLTNIDLMKSLRRVIEGQRVRTLQPFDIRQMRWVDFWQRVALFPFVDHSPERYGLVRLKKSGETSRATLSRLPLEESRRRQPIHRLIISLSLQPEHIEQYNQLVELVEDAIRVL